MCVQIFVQTGRPLRTLSHAHHRSLAQSMAAAAAVLPNLERLNKEEIVFLLDRFGVVVPCDITRLRKKKLADMFRDFITESPPRGVPMTMDPEVACMH